jgi:predicted amidohydrolase YtcJ
MMVFEGDIVTCDDAMRVSRYLIAESDWIVYVGDELPAAFAKAPRTVLGKRALLPAFADTHLHFSSYALFAASLDVRAAATIAEMVELVASYHASHPRGVVLGFGASAHSVAERRLIERADIDARFPDRPIMIIKYDGHASISNGAMLKRLPARIKALRGYDEKSGHLLNESFFAATDFVTGSVSSLKPQKFILPIMSGR